MQYFLSVSTVHTAPILSGLEVCIHRLTTSGDIILLSAGKSIFKNERISLKLFSCSLIWLLL